MIDAYGPIYEGEWKEAKTTGNGAYICNDGTKYVGEFKNNMRHGFGRHTTASGHVYEGPWKDDNISGI